MRLVIAGGGTGGHLFPGVAVAEELLARDGGSEVLFVGTARGIEARVVPQLGWKLELIDASGLKTVGAFGALRGLFRLPRAYFQSKRIVKTFAPDAVLGVGGYASGPVVLAARLNGVPTAILENNSVPGLANRWLGRWVDAVFLAFEEAQGRFRRDRVLMTGNPIRARLRRQPEDSASDRLRVLCFGGSLGARAVNAIMVDAAIELAKGGLRPAIVHQTGKDDREAVAARYREAGLDADVREFIDDMAAEYARADLIVARAGATTVAELTCVGRPAILIPYPFAADDHQTTNARALEKAGAALLFPQAELSGERLARALRELAADPARRAQMATAMKSLGRPEAAAAIVDWLQGRTARA
jgi:UDP-N-acetylglucosamine--N-acetylmuramyl-(pentapeptide) pyrophosphoryl-undecaprenol N-acetylglucosamine transferase